MPDNGFQENRSEKRKQAADQYREKIATLSTEDGKSRKILSWLLGFDTKDSLVESEIPGYDFDLSVTIKTQYLDLYNEYIEARDNLELRIHESQERLLDKLSQIRSLENTSKDFINLLPKKPSKHNINGKIVYYFDSMAFDNLFSLLDLNNSTKESKKLVERCLITYYEDIDNIRDDLKNKLRRFKNFIDGQKIVIDITKFTIGQLEEVEDIYEKQNEISKAAQLLYLEKMSELLAGDFKLETFKNILNSLEYLYWPHRCGEKTTYENPPKLTQHDCDQFIKTIYQKPVVLENPSFTKEMCEIFLNLYLDTISKDFIDNICEQESPHQTEDNKNKVKEAKEKIESYLNPDKRNIFMKIAMYKLLSIFHPESGNPGAYAVLNNINKNDYDYHTKFQFLDEANALEESLEFRDSDRYKKNFFDQLKTQFLNFLRDKGLKHRYISSDNHTLLISLVQKSFASINPRVIDLTEALTNSQWYTDFEFEDFFLAGIWANMAPKKTVLNINPTYHNEIYKWVSTKLKTEEKQVLTGYPGHALGGNPLRVHIDKLQEEKVNLIIENIEKFLSKYYKDSIVIHLLPDGKISISSDFETRSKHHSDSDAASPDTEVLINILDRVDTSSNIQKSKEMAQEIKIMILNSALELEELKSKLEKLIRSEKNILHRPVERLWTNLDEELIEDLNDFITLINEIKQTESNSNSDLIVFKDLARLLETETVLKKIKPYFTEPSDKRINIDHSIIKTKVSNLIQFLIGKKEILSAEQ